MRACENCNRDISKSNYARHLIACKSGRTFVKMEKCPHCEISFKNIKSTCNHVRWCKSNPKNTIPKIIKKRIGFNDEYKKKMSETIKELWKTETYINSQMNRPKRLGQIHSKETKEKMSVSALKSKHRRLCKSTRKYIKKSGEIVLLDSSWEEILAKRLDHCNIEWIRPKETLKWIDSKNVEHNYFPDFYIPKHDIYLDPKNPIAFLNQIEKVEYLQEHYKNVIFIKTKKECEDFDIYVHLNVGVSSLSSKQVKR